MNCNEIFHILFYVPVYFDVTCVKHLTHLLIFLRTD